MKKPNMILSIALTLGFLVGPQVHAKGPANPEEDLKTAVKNLYTALNSRDADTFLKYIAPDGYTEFSYDGGPLFAVREERVRRSFSIEFKANLRIEELQVKMLKDAAVVTGYRVGTLVRPDGTGHHIPRLRISMMWFFQEGNWKVAHIHLSKTNEEE